MGLFRQAALDKLSSPEQLDLLLEVTSPKGWIALIGLGALIACGIVWSIVGSLPSRVQGSGILLKKGGLTSVNVLAAGQLTEIKVIASSEVQKGQVLARLALPELRAELESAQSTLANLVSQNRQLTGFGEDGILLEKSILSQKRHSAIEQIGILNERAVNLSRKLAAQTKLLADGLITEQAVQDTRESLINAQADVGRVRGTIKEFSAKGTEDLQRKLQDNGERRIRIEELRRRTTELTAKIERYSTLVSPVRGRVLEIRAAVGALVTPGMPIVMLETSAALDASLAPSQALEAIVYVPASEGKKVATGMSVEVAPSTVVREEYGSIVGTVTAVAEYPTSADAITARLGSQELATSFLRTVDTPLELRITLLPDPNTRSGYKWTSPQGPPQKILQGTLCHAWITVRTRAPISLVLPLLTRDLH